jgi:hypothetical protein
MKKLVLTVLVSTIIITASAQVPPALNYQAIARNSMGQIVPSQSIGVRFTILDLAGTTIFYQETHSSTTNNFGLFTLPIGKGTVVSGTFTAIDWGALGDKYLKVEIAPQGGTTYTIQGVTQLLSVPYALYSEKTKLIGGNAITITNGNTINSNYVAGTGISIAGNTISSTANLNSWLLNGNSATTAANFLGTTDNQPLRVRVNNANRMTVEAPISTTSGTVGITSISDFTNIATAPGQLAIYGRDIPGTSMNMHLFSSVAGMTWAPQGGANNTMGRHFRLSQYTSSDVSLGEFYDFGMDQGKSFFISEHGVQNEGPAFFKKMLTISPQDFVGINFNWGENPTANFHTKGTLRFEGVNTNNALARVLVMDANGNVSSRDASTLAGTSYWLPDANGIYYTAGNVGVGGNSRNDTRFSVMSTAAQNWAMDVNSASTWETAVNVRNNTVTNAWYQFIVGGSDNIIPTYGVGAGNFGIVNARDGLATTIPFIITKNDMVGIGGTNGGSNFIPKAKLHVQDGDVYIDKIGSGVIMKSPNGSCWRMTVSNTGTPVFTSISCP